MQLGCNGAQSNGAVDLRRRAAVADRAARFGQVLHRAGGAYGWASGPSATVRPVFRVVLPHIPTSTRIQGTTGKELVCFTNELLAEAGVTNGLHRMLLLNRRDELLSAEKERQANNGYIAAGGAVLRAAPPGAGSTWIRQNSGLQVCGSLPQLSLAHTLHTPFILWTGSRQTYGLAQTRKLGATFRLYDSQSSCCSFPHHLQSSLTSSCKFLLTSKYACRKPKALQRTRSPAQSPCPSMEEPCLNQSPLYQPQICIWWLSGLKASPW